MTDTHKKIGIAVLKIMLTIVAFIFAAGLGAALGTAFTGSDLTSMSIASLLAISMIAPIWFAAPLWWRVAAACGGMAAGLGTWLLSLFVGSSDIALTSHLVGALRAGAIFVSLVACVSILRAGRKRLA